MDELSSLIKDLKTDLNQATERTGLSQLEDQLAELRNQMKQPDFWKNNQKAQAAAKQEAALARRLEPWLELEKNLEEVEELANLKDQTLAVDLSKQIRQLQNKLAERKKELQFQGPYDDHDVILSIHAGAGGTDAQDWAQMLLRMYIRWAESHKLKVRTIDQSLGEEAGIKSADIEISGGNFLYGKLAGEHGVHRLVRLSPFNADNLRQTSFAKVEVVPLIRQAEEVVLDDKDIKIDVYRAGGHGGQSVNTTDSAVRVTHIPSGVTVAIQNERSQLQNKETALSILRSKLAALQAQQHSDSLSQIKGPNQSAEWGNQIRSYVLHPYKQVKDTRSGYETSDAEKVLSGDLDALLEAGLQA